MVIIIIISIIIIIVIIISQQGARRVAPARPRLGLVGDILCFVHICVYIHTYTCNIIICCIILIRKRNKIQDETLWVQVL